MSLEGRHIVNSLDELNSLGALLSREVAGGMTFGLSGQLGAGKTTFVRCLMQHLRSPDNVSSPTYVLEQEYRTAGGLNVEHWDLYRLAGPPQELLEEPQKGNVRIIEWIDKFAELKQMADLIILIEFMEPAHEQHRAVTITRQR